MAGSSETAAKSACRISADLSPLRHMKISDSVKQRTFAKERAFFSPYACLSENTRGRARDEKPCDMRTDFQRDRDRIIYSKAFLRLKNKTQVFFSPEGDHFRTRMTHTIDVSQIARSIVRSLALNEDLAEAIALGHDLGHTPFGHAGERVLNSLSPFGFAHNEQSLRVVDVLEKDGKGNIVYRKNSTISAEDDGKREKLLEEIDPSVLSSDQYARLSDIAVDLSKTSGADVRRIETIASASGASYALSSIHLNIWFGDYSKSSGLRHFFPQLDIGKCAYIGDALNDEEMFSLFPLSFGVRSVEALR